MCEIKLHQLNDACAWVKANALLQTEDGQEMALQTYPISKNFVLHKALYLGAPDYFVLNLIKANPKALMSKGFEGTVPLHVAVKHGASDVIIKKLLDVRPEAVLAHDNHGRLPQDYALQHHGQYLLEAADVAVSKDNRIAPAVDKILQLEKRVRELEIKLGYDSSSSSKISSTCLSRRTRERSPP